jgi:hypothetical protein
MPTTTTTETCGACGSGFASITEVFSHACPALVGRRGRGLAEAPSSRPQGGGAATEAPAAPNGPTDKQVAFLARLAAERGVEVPEVATKAQASAAIDALLAQPVARAASASPATSVRSNRYAGRCGHCGTQVAEGEGSIDKVDGRWVTYHLADACPASSAPSSPAPRHGRVEEDGFYLNPETDEVYKVQVAHHGSGALYAKRLVLPDAGLERGGWNYEAGLIGRIDPAWRLTFEAAQAWGRLYGYCCRCGAILTDEDSIARGMGPICAGKF